MAVVPKASKVLSRPGHKFSERDFVARCNKCDHERNLLECATTANSNVREYRCRSCGDLLLLIGYPTDRPSSKLPGGVEEWWSMRPVSDLYVHLKDSRLVIPAAERAPVFGQPLL